MFSPRIFFQVFLVLYYLKESSPKFWNALASLDPLTDVALLLKGNATLSPSLNKDDLQIQAEDRKFKIIKVLNNINKINKISSNFFKKKRKALKNISKRIPKYIKQFKNLTKKRRQRFFGGKKQKLSKKRQKCVPWQFFKQFTDDYEDYEEYDNEDDRKPVNNQHFNYFYYPPPYVAAYPMPFYHPQRRSQEGIQENYNRRNTIFTTNERNFSHPQINVYLPRQHIKILPVRFNTEGQKLNYDPFSNKDRTIPVIEMSAKNVARKELGSGRNVLHANYSSGKGMDANGIKLKL